MAQHDFVANLLLQYPDLVVQRYVQTKHYPMDAKLAYLYLAAMQQTQQFLQFRVEDVIRRLQTVDPYASQLLQQEFNMAAASAESSDTTPTTTSSSTHPSTGSSTPSTKGMSKRDQVHTCLASSRSCLDIDTSRWLGRYCRGCHRHQPIFSTVVL
jgi:hypothetical protein